MRTDYALQAYSLYTSSEPYLRPVRQLVWQLQAASVPLVNQFLTFSQEQPAIITLFLLAFMLVISLQILNFARRVIAWWMRLVVRLVFYGGLIVLALAIWQRGVGETVEDVSGWGREVAEVWSREYRRWEATGKGSAGGARGPKRW